MLHVSQRCFGLHGLVACENSVNAGCVLGCVRSHRALPTKIEEHFRLNVGHHLVSSAGDAG